MSPAAIARACAAVLMLLAVATPARAFTVSSAFSDGCHESITEAALRSARVTLPPAATIPPTENERRLVADLPFVLPSDMQDLASASVLVGVRDNDLKGNAPSAVDEMALVTADPDQQQEHCLRAPGDDEPDGSANAVARCAKFVQQRAMAAVEALDAAGFPDPNVREPIAVYLSFRGTVTATLPAFWVRIGQALHALQDSFAHTYRTADGMHPTVALNWVDLANEKLVESRDGPPHKVDLDRCNAGDALRSRNEALAIEASTALLRAVLDPSRSVDQKSAAVGAVVAEYMSYSPGCDYANQWCDAPENAFAQTNFCGCSVPGRLAAPGVGLALLALAVVAAAARKRRWMAGAVGALVLLFASTARADDHEERGPRFGFAANVAGSFVDPALAGSVGLRMTAGQHFILGLDAELNGWYGLDGSRWVLGATSFYASGIVRYPVRRDLALRTTLSFGGAIELADLYGVPAGSSGFFAGVYPLGVEWRLTERVALILNPLGFAIPVTHITGAPFGYPQFRTQIGIELGI